MALQIVETFGFRPADQSPAALEARLNIRCPFTLKTCWKKFGNQGKHQRNGTCVVKPTNGPEVIVCYDRLYGNDYQVLSDVSVQAFGPGAKLIRPTEIAATQGESNRVVAFGKNWGKELRVPKDDDDENTSYYSADWVLVKLDESGKMVVFAPLEVQSMDTTGSYQLEWCSASGVLPPDHLPTGKGRKAPGINWENVNKRIIPQLLTKGYIFMGEDFCVKGSFFVCPTPVFEHLMKRLGAKPKASARGVGSLTFLYYSLSPLFTEGSPRSLHLDGILSTRVEHVKDAFFSTLSLPSMNSMQKKIEAALAKAVKLPKPKKPNTKAAKAK